MKSVVPKAVSGVTCYYEIVYAWRQPWLEFIVERSYPEESLSLANSNPSQADSSEGCAQVGGHHAVLRPPEVAVDLPSTLGPQEPS